MESGDEVDLYGASYGDFSSSLYAGIREEVFDQDLGQTGWMTADEQDRYLSWLDLHDSAKLLDVACGSGGPTLRLVRETGASVVGIDVHEQGIEAARQQTADARLEARATFEVVDASGRLPFPDESFAALVCIDAVNHLPDRVSVLSEWYRVLEPEGRLVYTDPIVVTGALSDEEMRIRSSIGFYLFVSEGFNERLLQETGFELREVEDRTGNMARMGRRWFEERSEREVDLREVEGDASFDGQQAFFRTTAELAEERRLSRFVYYAQR